MKMQFLLKILMVSPYFLCCILFISKLHLCNSAIVVFELCNMTFFISFKFQPSLLSYIFFAGKAPVKEPCLKTKIPFFCSPSVPSFRMFEELDDLGNYVADPNLRRPVGTTCDTSCPLDRALSMVHVLFHLVYSSHAKSLYIMYMKFYLFFVAAVE